MMIYEDAFEYEKKRLKSSALKRALRTLMKDVKKDNLDEYLEKYKKKGNFEGGKAFLLGRILDDNKESSYEYQNGNLEEQNDVKIIDVTTKSIQLSIPKDYSEQDIKMQDVSKEPLFTHAPELSDIKQGELGDCYLLAALGAVVQRHPEAIINMMKDNGDGTVSVRFYNKKNQPVIIKVSKKIPKYEEMDLYAQNCLWVQMIEKAYAMSGLHKKRRGDYSYKDIIGGSVEEFGQHAFGQKQRDLTIAGSIGKRYNVKKAAKIERGTNILFTDLARIKKPANNEYDSFAEILFKKIAEYRRGAVAGMKEKSGNQEGLNGENKSGGIVYSHAYTITGVEEEEKGGHTYKFIRIRNPWGRYGREYEFNEEGKLVSIVNENLGEFRVELNDFISNIQEVEFL